MTEVSKSDDINNTDEVGVDANIDAREIGMKVSRPEVTACPQC